LKKGGFFFSKGNDTRKEERKKKREENRREKAKTPAEGKEKLFEQLSSPPIEEKKGTSIGKSNGRKCPSAEREKKTKKKEGASIADF